MGDYKQYSNSNLLLEQKRLSNKYEMIKKEIKIKFEELDKLDKEYLKIEREINMRKNILL